MFLQSPFLEHYQQQITYSFVLAVDSIVTGCLSTHCRPNMLVLTVPTVFVFCTCVGSGKRLGDEYQLSVCNFYPLSIRSLFSSRSIAAFTLAGDGELSMVLVHVDMKSDGVPCLWSITQTELIYTLKPHLANLLGTYYIA